MVFALDLGRKTAVLVSGSVHPKMALQADRYAYRFQDAAGNTVAIGRFDGMMVLAEAHRLTGSASAGERWTCTPEKVGPSF